MAWIESHEDLPNHPKTRRLARMLGISIPATVGHLHLLWYWVLKYSDDGDLGGFTDDDIADAAMWEGDPVAFFHALVDAGFIDKDEDGARVHDWHDYAGKLVQRRKANRERMRKARAEHNEDSATHVQRTNETRVKPPNRTEPNRTVPNPTNVKANLENESDVGASKTQPVKQQYSHPEWFEPLKSLEGYQDGKHERAIMTIEAACESYGVEPLAVIQEFVRYYPVGRINSGWKSPVKPLSSTIDIQCKKVRGEWRERANGKSPPGRPTRPQITNKLEDWDTW